MSKSSSCFTKKTCTCVIMGTANRAQMLGLVALILMVQFSVAGNIRSKRSDIELNLDANGFCLTAKNWKEDCNDCFCVEKGAPACTLKGCIHLPEQVTIKIEPEKEPLKPDIVEVKPSKNESSVDKKCVPGSKWTEACNSCWCTDDGLSVCTKIGCVDLGK